MLNRFAAVSLFGAVLLVLSPAARATLLCLPNLPPGGVEFPNVDDSCASDRSGSSPKGSVAADTGIQTFSFTGSGITTSGNLREVVFRESSGTLDFFIQLDVISGMVLSAVNDVNTGNFSTFLTAVGTVSPIQLLPGPAGTASPSFDTRSSTGDTIEWRYLSGIPVGTASYTMAISTDGTIFGPSNIGLLGAGGGTATLDGFQPLATTPEPLSIILLGTVLASFAIVARRRYSLKFLSPKQAKPGV